MHLTPFSRHRRRSTSACAEVMVRRMNLVLRSIGFTAASGVSLPDRAAWWQSLGPLRP